MQSWFSFPRSQATWWDIHLLLKRYNFSASPPQPFTKKKQASSYASPEDWQCQCPVLSTVVLVSPIWQSKVLPKLSHRDHCPFLKHTAYTKGSMIFIFSFHMLLCCRTPTRGKTFFSCMLSTDAILETRNVGCFPTKLKRWVFFFFNSKKLWETISQTPDLRHWK